MTAAMLWLPVGTVAAQSPAAILTGEIEWRADEPSVVENLAFQAPTPAMPASPPPPRPAPRRNAPPPTRTAQPPSNQFANQAPNQPNFARLSRAPDMFGDSFYSLRARTNQGDGSDSQLNLPLAGGSRVFKNEHSRALPTDRVFGLYHHFQNALEMSSPTGVYPGANANVDRFTFGFEKTLLDGIASVELRMPLSSPVSLSTVGSAYQTESVGDLVATVKGLLFADEAHALALGLAINVPTGSDIDVQLPNFANVSFTLHNDATHLIPFIAYQAAPTEELFFHAFVQVDTPTNANSVQIRKPSAPVGKVENRELTDQTLLFADASTGYWWFRAPEARWLTGLASLLELHYTTALNRADFAADSTQLVTFGPSTGRFDALNLTIGLHTEFARSTIIRAGYVTPLRDGQHRFFDSEFTVAVIFRR